MFNFQAEANRVEIGHYVPPDIVRRELDCAFDSKTGKPNFATILQCPNYEDPKWWQWWKPYEHDLICVYNGTRHYFPKLL